MQSRSVSIRRDPLVLLENVVTAEGEGKEKTEARTETAIAAATPDDADGIAPLPDKREPVSPRPLGSSALTRVGTVELDGKMYLTRGGRGAEIGEPLRCTRTNDEVIYIEFPPGDPEVRNKKKHSYEYMV
jgi:hypothetical protein